jgi:hypothetical protein
MNTHFNDRVLVNHNQTAVVAKKPRRALSPNHNKTAVVAPKPRRGLPWNHNQTAI